MGKENDLRMSGGIGRALKKVVSAPFKVVGKVLGVGGGGSQTVKVQTPEVTGAQIQASTQAQAPEAPVLGTENTTLDSNGKKKKKGKAGLLISKDNGSGDNSGGYTGLNI
mgnify:CR=1 FL=1